ncbi:phosphoribosyltransferase family protein, partial [Acaryochloris marina NIES-2412]|uniref:phosphoribosyltransferase family protein n=1 Tax=Acaryochloris marina TaxID=155978 RepID=UPI00405A46B9
ITRHRIKDHTLILVDDGIATGSTIRASITLLQKQLPLHIIVTAPVIEAGIYETLKTEVKEVVCLINPKPLNSIGFWYEDFSQTSDEKFQKLLAIENRCKPR